MENIQPLILSLIMDTMFCTIYPIFYSSILELKIKKWQYVLIMFSIFAFLTPFQYIFPVPQIAIFLLGVTINLVSVIIFSKESLVKKIIFTLIPYTSDAFCTSVYMVTRAYLMPDFQPVFGNKVFTDVIDVITILLQTILTLFIISKIIQHKKLKIHTFTAIYILAIMVFNIYILTFVMYIYCTNVRTSIFFMVIVIYMIIFAMLTVAVLHYSTLINKKQVKQEMIEQQHEFMSTQYEQLRNSYIGYKKLRHDIKDHLNVVNGLALQGKTEELKSYTNTLTEEWEMLSSKTFCDIPAVDIIIAEKYNIAETSKIKTDFVISDIKEANIDTVYLSSIFSNLLNNAIEASSHCKHDAYISLRCGITMKNLVIKCCNSMPDHIHKKNDPENHGHGLHIINDLAKLMNGTFVYEHDECTFTAVVTIPINDGRVS